MSTIIASIGDGIGWSFGLNAKALKPTSGLELIVKT